MASPSIYVAENYIYNDKSFPGSFPIYLRDACDVISVAPPPTSVDLDENVLKIAAEENSINYPRIIYTEDGRQGLLYTF